MKRYSDEQKKKFLEDIRKYISSGMTVTTAIKKVGISNTTYRNILRAEKLRSVNQDTENDMERYEALQRHLEEVIKANNTYHTENNKLKERVSKLEKLLGNLLIEKELQK